MSGCGCEIEVKDKDQRHVLILLLAINGLLFFIEAAVGWYADSTALIADSLDMLADASVYAIALWAVGNALHNKVTAARLSGYLQMLLALLILADIGRRMLLGSEPLSALMLIMGAVALLANMTCLVLISKHRHGDVHMRASWIFSSNDVIANLGVLASALLVHYSQSRWPDLVIGLIIALVVLRGAVKILQEADKETG